MESENCKLESGGEVCKLNGSEAVAVASYLQLFASKTHGHRSVVVTLDVEAVPTAKTSTGKKRTGWYLVDHGAATSKEQ
ncbi:conserved hypothetical protein [Ricinus communis]|uniref:Uncharacterized protein n=1 Tax=Ricinus communis TaxID=3988 RepID=B9RY45_RICCO|nr:conserved hypothetical protein [Ricinus communis]